jgi:hypothetical protein
VSQPATNVLLKVAPKGDKLRKSLRSLLNSKGRRKSVGWLGFIHPFFVIKVPPSKSYLEKKIMERKQGSRHPPTQDGGMDTINSREPTQI